MDDFDDYFQDSFELNEDDLAVLDREEQKYAEEVIARTQRQPEREPPPKRQKLSHDEDSDDIVDVFIQPNGLYGLGSSVQQQAKPRPTYQVLPPTLKNAPPLKPIRQPVTAPSASRPRMIAQTPLASQTTAQSRPRNNDNERQILKKADVIKAVDPSSNPISSSRTDAENTAFKKELEKNRETTEKLKKQVEDGEQLRKELQMARFASDGEATILRKKLEKLSQQMAESERKVKDLEEARQREKSQLQKEHKESLDRLRTEQQFKQHELESSGRKAGHGTARLNRIAASSQQSPIPLPPAMRDWTSSSNRGLAGNASITLTPSRAPVARKIKLSAADQTSVSELRFPGFENSFAQPSQRLSPSKGARPGTPSRRKEKDKAGEAVTSAMFSPSKGPPRPFVFDDMGVDDSIQDYDAEMAFADGSPRRQSARLHAAEVSKSDPVIPDTPSVNGVDLFPDSDDNQLVVVEPYVGIDWKEELHHLLFSHVCAGSKLNTLHQLISAETEDADYVQATSSLIEAVGSKLTTLDEGCLEGIAAEKLVTMGIVLSRRQALQVLKTFFELLSSLSVTIYKFSRILLKAHGSVQSRDMPFLAFVRESMHTSLSVMGSSEEGQPDVVNAIHGILRVVESVFWVYPETECSDIDGTEELVQIFKPILDLRQPFPILSHALRALVVLATHPSLLEPLIMTEKMQKPSSENPKAVLIEKLSSFLVDPAWTNDFERYKSFSHIFQFFALLADAREGARSCLVNSPTNILCIIHFLANQTSLLWEDNELVLDSPENSMMVVQNIIDALQLLHRLLVGPVERGDVENFDFRQKLYYAPHIAFNGLAHMFIVMIGRLSYADPPDWLSMKLQADIERLTEPARDLMDMIIEGPEGDSVWEAYQEYENENEAQETQTEADVEMDELMGSVEL